MNRRERDSGMVGDDLFGAVAMMRIKIPDGHALSALLERVECRNRGISEVAEAHRSIACGMMSWRSHQAKGRCSLQSTLRCRDSCPGRTERVLINVRISGGVGVEFVPGLFHLVNVLGRMSAQ